MVRRVMIAIIAALAAAQSGGFAASHPAPYPVTLSEKAAARLLVSEQRPEYPAVARVNYIQGDVYLRIQVSAEGKVEEAHVIRGEPLLAAASLEAVRHWQFRPLQDGAKPEAFETLFRIHFSLRFGGTQQMPLHPQLDLARAIQPPKLVTNPAASARTFRMRILVGTDGTVLDSMGVGAQGPVGEGRNTVRNWKFLPARWGTLNVPWYVDVDVPVAGASDDAEADQAGGV